MRILVACEFSGIVRDAFAARGHDAWSCDLLPSAVPGPPHYMGDVRDILDGFVPVSFQSDCDPEGDGWCQQRDVDPAECPGLGPTQDGVEYVERNGMLMGRYEDAPAWDMLIAFPPCTYVCVSGMHWTTRGLRDPKLTEDALDFARLLLSAPIKRKALENPISIISSRIRKPSQIIQPYQFGHDASKKTCLWLENLPQLSPTALVEPRIVGGKNRWANQTDSGQNKLGPSVDRWALRSETYPGIADAMADQWGNLAASDAGAA